MPDGKGIDLRQVQGQVGPAGLHEIKGGGLLLHPDQFIQGVAPQVAQGFLVGIQVRDLQVILKLIHGQEGNQLVGRPFHVKLQLGMLIGGSQGPDRGAAGIHDLALEILALSQAFSPKLAEPIRHAGQAAGVGHEHQVGPGFGGSKEIEEGGQAIGRVLVRRGVFQVLIHEPGPGEEFLHINAGENGGQEPHGGEHREAPPHIGGNGQGSQALFSRQAPERPCFRVGGDDEALPGLGLPHPALEQFVYPQELGQGLGGMARIC